MKVSLSWLNELVEYNLTSEELANKLSLITIGVKDLTENYLELDLTYNRGDLLSLRGVAREVAAIMNTKTAFENPQLPKTDLPQTPAKIEDEKLCPVYCLAKIEGLKVTPSEPEWTKKLADSGIRSVNNVADITNLIMLEYGQPMHAFDANKVHGKIIVRTAKQGEQLLTLDNKNRKLDPEDLLIADEHGPIGLAGVMGGKDSEISDQTTTILLEAAIFDPTTNRKASKRHGLYSEATKRFQHGLTKTNLLQALAAAVEMYQKLGGKLTALSLIGNLTENLKKVELTQQKINSLLGINISPSQVESALQSLGFHLRGVHTNSWEVTAPYWRLDISIEEDLIEEVARIFGYEKIEGEKLADETLPKLDQAQVKTIASLKAKLKNLGLTEIQSYSFYSTAVLEALSLSTDDLNKLIKVANPISLETKYLRENLWPILVEAVAKNIKHGFKDIAIFEIGETYSPQVGKLPKEEYKLCITLMNGTENPLEELISLFQNLGLHPEGIKLNQPEGAFETTFHPKRFAAVEKDGKQIGFLAEVHPRFLNKMGIEKRVAILEIELDYLQ